MAESFFKKKTPEDLKYRAWIRTQECVVDFCQRDSEVSHMEAGGMGMKCSDYRTLPKCHEHHMEYHRGAKTFLEKYNIDKWQKIAIYQEQYLVELKEGVRKI